MKKFIKFLYVFMSLFVFNISAKTVTVFRCCSPFNLCDLTNFKSQNECIRMCGGLNSCQPVDIEEKD